MSEIGETLAKAFPFAVQLPNYRALCAELDELKATYTSVLNSESTPRAKQ